MFYWIFLCSDGQQESIIEISNIELNGSNISQQLPASDVASSGGAVQQDVASTEGSDGGAVQQDNKH